MSDEHNGNLNLIPISTVDNQHYLRILLQSSPSTISFETANIPRDILDILNEVYSNRRHRQCIHMSYFTLLSMTLAVFFWIGYWLSYTRCHNIKNPESNAFLCDLIIIFEVLTFTLIGISPVMIVATVYLWIAYSCYNPFDSIRDNFLGFKIEGEQWKKQLDYYYQKKKTRYFNCLRCKQQKELHERGHGYIILSPHGIVIDELLMFTGKKKIIRDGIVLDDEKMLNLTFNRTCQRPWRNQISIYLPEDLINRQTMEEITELLKISINTNALLPPCF
ncbi:unnamed protein product [Adineta ricciae]|uniref:Uncharacterized protein n=1 Tax=Adineta ricciae TaxID=249248 RepID=A0A814QEP0_ADIRI|nr:unnamed protein product [Adineta ricciae]CAF1118472.1 unnamed protein product [Adineta ricciae]